MERVQRTPHSWRYRLDRASQLAGCIGGGGIIVDLALLLLLGLGLAQFTKFLLVLLLILLGLTFPFWLLLLDEEWRMRRERRMLTRQGVVLEDTHGETEPDERALLPSEENALEDVWIAALAIGILVGITVIAIVIGRISPNPSIRTRFDPRGLSVAFIPAFAIAMSFLVAKLVRYQKCVHALRNVLRREVSG